MCCLRTFSKFEVWVRHPLLPWLLPPTIALSTSWCCPDKLYIFLLFFLVWYLRQFSNQALGVIVTSEFIVSPYRQNVWFRHFSIFIRLYTYDLDLWPLTLKTFSAVLAHMMNICGKFHWNPSTKYTYRDIVSREIGPIGWHDRSWTISISNLCLLLTETSNILFLLVDIFNEIVRIKFHSCSY